MVTLDSPLTPGPVPLDLLDAIESASDDVSVDRKASQILAGDRLYDMEFLQNVKKQMLTIRFKDDKHVFDFSYHKGDDDYKGLASRILDII